MTAFMCRIFGHKFPDRFTNRCVYCGLKIKVDSIRPKDIRS